MVASGVDAGCPQAAGKQARRGRSIVVPVPGLSSRRGALDRSEASGATASEGATSSCTGADVPLTAAQAFGGAANLGTNGSIFLGGGGGGHLRYMTVLRRTVTGTVPISVADSDLIAIPLRAAWLNAGPSLSAQRGVSLDNSSSAGLMPSAVASTSRHGSQSNRYMLSRAFATVDGGDRPGRDGCRPLGGGCNAGGGNVTVGAEAGPRLAHPDPVPHLLNSRAGASGPGLRSAGLLITAGASGRFTGAGQLPHRGSAAMHGAAVLTQVAAPFDVEASGARSGPATASATLNLR